MRRDEDARHGWRWLALHETWLPGEDIGLSVQSPDRPSHPSNPPRKSIAREILVDICGAEH